MQCYIDSSALIKRAVMEAETPDMIAFLDILRSQETSFVTSALSQIELSQTLHRAAADGRVDAIQFDDDYKTVLTGIDIIDIAPAVIIEACSIGTGGLRSLDAIHLATARLAGADMVVTYDNRMIRACFDAGVMTARPGIKEESPSPSWEWVTGDDPADVPEELWPEGW